MLATVNSLSRLPRRPGQPLFCDFIDCVRACPDVRVLTQGTFAATTCLRACNCGAAIDSLDPVYRNGLLPGTSVCAPNR
jgi:hypothetical protein